MSSPPTLERRRRPLARSFRLGLFVAAVLGNATGLFAWQQVQHERRIDLEDVTSRSYALAQQLSARVSQALELPEEEARESLEGRLEGYRRLLGYAVFRADGRMVGAGTAMFDFARETEDASRAAMLSQQELVRVTRAAGARIHILAKPVPPAGTPAGALVVVHDVSYLDDRATARFSQYAFWILIETLLAIALVVGSTWLAYERPLSKLADWMRRLRVDNVAEAPPGLPTGQLRSESDRLAASFRAARSTGRALSEAAVHVEQVWTRDRLRAHAIASLGEANQLIVVSNREPYMHRRQDGKPRLMVPAGGLVTALDPVLEACGGLWIAHGAGEADRETADAAGRLTVPPGDPRYTLRRVWLTREEEQGYYYGLANEGLWPLCHLAHERPIFRVEDWEQYVRVNRRFADTVLEEAGASGAVILVQDYHLALLPRMLKSTRPDLRVGLFWHVPWPNPEAFRICPWAVEILDGMLGADLVGFHLQQYGNNFLDTVDRTIESRVDRDHFAVELRGSRTAVRPFPISVQPWVERNVPRDQELAGQIAAVREQHQLGDAFIAVGVDRIDYTKGLPERFRACERLLQLYPQYRGRFTLVQLGAPSRTHIPRYREYLDHLEALADEINWKYQTDRWKPIRFLIGHHDADTVYTYLHMAPMCIVSSLHDGMNLVAKEYVAAQAGGSGVLVLSEFAGASRELVDALIVNPYDIEQFAEAIRRGIEMPATERFARMQRMNAQIEANNIYRWAGNLLSELSRTQPSNVVSTTGS
ncbi:MAG: trehalose-6-phosphate synthase [Candidatus Latescibacteria bacterium]|nr:trehalose-6-phosphate synthase [Candidatus Latescibacterota bacterium]